VAVLQKIAFVGATVVLLGAAVATTLAPSYRSGEPCGTWVSPERPSEQFVVILGSVRGSQIHGARDEFAGETARALFEQRCDERLDSRRLVSLTLGGLGIALPLGAYVLTTRRRLRT
jgi:hypothetical protein